MRWDLITGLNSLEKRNERYGTFLMPLSCFVSEHIYFLVYVETSDSSDVTKDYAGPVPDIYPHREKGRVR